MIFGSRGAVYWPVHLPFSISHLSFGTSVAAGLQMTNEKWKMENDKWKMLQFDFEGGSYSSSAATMLSVCESCIVSISGL